MRRTLALLGATALLLTGCEAPAVYGPSPTPTTPPIFASEEEALDAAEEAWDAYLHAFNAVASGTAADLAPFDGLVSEEQLEVERAFAEQLRAEGRTLVGVFESFDFRLQQVDNSTEGAVFLQAYTCLDTRESMYRHADGTEARPNQAVAPLEVLFEAHEEPVFVVSEVREWTGRDFCASDS